MGTLMLSCKCIELEVDAVLLQRVMRGLWVGLTPQYMKQTHSQILMPSDSLQHAIGVTG